jgi:hypothetical protein
LLFDEITKEQRPAAMKKSVALKAQEEEEKDER